MHAALLATLDSLALIACYFLLNYAIAGLVGWSTLRLSSQTCYFLLNYARPSCRRRPWTSSCSPLAIFFWIMPSARVPWQGKLQTCKILQYPSLLFSFELCLGLPKRWCNVAESSWSETCYFLLNYAYRFQLICLDCLCKWFVLLFSFELCWRRRNTGTLAYQYSQ